MSNRRNKKKKRKLAVRGPRRAGANDSGIRQLYRHACELSERGDHEAARRLYGHLEATVADSRLKALIRNDLGVLAAIAGDAGAALQGFEAALAADAQCEPARANRTFWEAEFPEHPEEPVRSPPPRAPLEAGTATPCIPNPPPI